MAHGDGSQTALTWVGIWVASKTELAPYPPDLSVVRFPNFDDAAFCCRPSRAFQSA
ncbi:hypothetical protein BRAS3843_520220 [Bradyrhizobium sp. STM 3843]|nr:hypothetical protein BRAS3843_520220 [Bradyrhizobium sp. STM 3843]